MPKRGAKAAKFLAVSAENPHSIRPCFFGLY